jgi:hypothetical protein
MVTSSERLDSLPWNDQDDPAVISNMNPNNETGTLFMMHSVNVFMETKWWAHLVFSREPGYHEGLTWGRRCLYKVSAEVT